MVLPVLKQDTQSNTPHLEGAWPLLWPCLQEQRLCRTPNQAPALWSAGLRFLAPCGFHHLLAFAAPEADIAQSTTPFGAAADA